MIHVSVFSLKMVQRKVPSKLAIQADHVKSEKRLGNLKPTSCQHQDGKNRGPDMKKKMKRSRSIKLSDIESLKSSPLRKTISQPGKPPPFNASTTAAATSEKQPVIKAADGSPNYMKSTSSSEARKERSQVSSLNAQTSSDSKNLHRRGSSNLKLSSASSNKSTRTLTKTSSLKLVRTLTKTPSFKPVRATTKKCARVALCADMNAQKATCSSTLKDSKFPAYLMLNPGGTEAEGTSVMKVCPYNYCSLNGYHHTPLPPLKCLLKARRRSLKTQKSMKLDVVSPRRAKPSGDGTDEIADGLLYFSDNNTVNSVPMIQEVDIDFFIEIYAKDTEDEAKATTKSREEDDVGTTDLARESKEQDDESSFYGGREAVAEQDNNKPVAACLSDASSCSTIDFEENFVQHNNNNLVEKDITAGFLENNKVEDVNADYPPIFYQEAILGIFDGRSDTEGECYASMHEDDNISEATDMEWEEGQFPTSEVDTEADYLNKPDGDESCTNVEYTSEIKKIDLHDEPEISLSDDVVSNCTEEILADEVLQELFEEETAPFDMQCNDRDSEMDGITQNCEVVESTQVIGSITSDQLSLTEDASKVLTTMEEKGKEAETDLIGTATTAASMGEPIGESTAAGVNIQEDGVWETENDIFETSPQLGDAENSFNTDKTSETLNGHQEDGSLQANDATWLQSQIAYPSQNPDEIGKVETNEDYNSSLQPKDTENDQNLAIDLSILEQELPLGEDGDATEDQEQAAIQVSDPSQSFSEADRDDGEINDNQIHITIEAPQLDEIAEDSNCSQDSVNKSGSSEPDNHQLDGHHKSANVLESQNLMEEDQDAAKKYKIPTSVDSEQQSDSRMYKISSPGKNTGQVKKMEEEVCTKSDTGETFLTANNGPCLGSECTILRTRSNSNQELSDTCKNRKWTIRCKKTTKDLEEQRGFNPREPNFLPVVPDPEAEKVDLRHQMMDDRKNAEEWMLDYALQKAVTKLAPARKRKVALLVEAFETVLPMPQYETHIRHTSGAFSHTSPIHACS